MLHYSNASSIEKNRRYLAIKGGACLLLWQVGGVINSVVELGSSSVGLVVYRREEGEETMNTMQTNAYWCMTWQVTMLGVPNRGSRWYRQRGETSGRVFPVLAFSERWTGGEMLQVHYARDVWWTNGLRIRIRLVVLSNFHVQSFSIRATAYFVLIFNV